MNINIQEIPDLSLITLDTLISKYRMIYHDIGRMSIYRVEDILCEAKSAFEKLEIDPHSRKPRGFRIDIENLIGIDACSALYESVLEAYSSTMAVLTMKWNALNSTRGGEMFGLDMIDIAYGHFVSVMSKLIDLRNKMIKTN